MSCSAENGAFASSEPAREDDVMTGTYLYIYRNDRSKRVYVGIGNSPGRVWEHHNDKAAALLSESDTKVFITTEPFPDRASAERAESAAICAAAAAGVEVIVEEERAKDLMNVANIAKVGSSKHLTPAVFEREGTVRYDSLERTAIVTLHHDDIDDVGDGIRRPALHGGRDPEIFHQRATRWWGLGAADARRFRKRTDDGVLPRDVDRLVAVQKSTSTILGAWTLADEQWRRDANSWMFVTDEPIDDWRGQRLDWCGASHSGGAMIWSADIREELRGGRS
jgi:predicted GIY-YIG superfamily endonuclease